MKTFAERLSEIDELIAAAGNVPRESLIKVCHHLHQMVAGCGIYELSELCNLTVEAEELCKQVLRGPSGLAPEQEKSLRRLLHDMKCIVER